MEVLATIAVTVFASTGFWQFLGEWIKQRYGKRSVQERLLVGIAHDRIHFLCSQYIKKGFMSADEFDSLKDIAEPYLEMGGNGSGKRLYERCSKELEIRASNE